MNSSDASPRLPQHSHQPRRLPFDESKPHHNGSLRDSADNTVDSGYGSLAGTPINPVEKRQPAGLEATFDENHAATRNCSKILFTPRPGLFCFDKALDVAVMKWFEDTEPQIERLLVEFLKSGRRLSRNFKPTAIRLMMLGEIQSTARPHLVVFSPPKGTSKIDKFFSKVEVKELLVLRDGGVSIPVIIHAHTRFLTHGISSVPALCSRKSMHYRLSTLCGMPIILGGLRRATLGGLIMVRCSGIPGVADTNPKFFGLTVGHLFGDEETDNSDCEDSDDGQQCDQKDDVFKSTPPCLSLSEALTPDSSSWNWAEGTQLGFLVDLGKGAYGQPDLDWSLIEVKRVLPNLIDAGTSDGGFRKADLVTPKYAVGFGAPHRSVVVVSGTRGPQPGKLIFTPTRVMVGQSESFSNAYILKLDQGSIDYGDSGSWVIDQATYEVYGHVMGVDLFGDAHVIPMFDTLQDIKSRLDASAVDLPLTVDILASSGFIPDVQQSGSSPERPSTPVPSTPEAQVDSGYATASRCTPQTVFHVLQLQDSDLDQ